MTDQPVKRLNYFDNQFLHAKDFNDEQEYHISMRRLHNSILHTAGVAQGLELVINADQKSVTVKPGVAVDAVGREIWLKKEQIKDVSSFAGNKVFVTIEYTEQLTDKTEETGGEGDTRWTENDPDQNKDMIAIKNNVSDPTLELVLGRVDVDNNGVINGIDDGEDPNRRRLAGTVGGDMEMRRLTLIGSGDDKNLWPKLEGQDNKLHVTTDVEVNGGLEATQVTSDNAQVNTELKVASLKLTGSGDENTWPRVENQNNKLYVTTGAKIEGDLEVTGNLNATLGAGVVGADQVQDGSITLKKLSKSFIGPRKTTINPNSTLTLRLDDYPVDSPRESFYLVHAHTTATGVGLSWTEGSIIASTSPNVVQRVIFFSNPSSSVISLNYTILQFFNS